MDKHLKKIIVAIVVLALCVGVFFLVKGCDKTGEESQSSPSGDAALPLCNYENNQISKITFTNQYGSYTFVCNAGIWGYEEDMMFPADQTAFNNIATSISSVSALRDITDEKGDDADYGLGDGALTLDVTFNDGNTQSFVIGDYNSNVSGTYLKTGDKVYVSGTGLGNTLDVPLFDFVKTTEIAVLSSDTVTSIDLNGTEYTDAEWIAAFMAKYDQVYSLGVEDYKNHESYGFTGEENTVTIKYTTTSQNVLDDGSIIDVTNDNEYTFGFVVKDDIQYMMLPDDDLIYTVSGADGLLNVEVTDAETNPLLALG